MQTLHETYMQRCLHLASLGMGSVSPNPMVGCVLVHQNRIIGEGFHKKYGDAHAEVNCIQSVAEADQHLIAEGTLYVSLEPCSHFGKTPPCTDLILNHGIKKVVVGCQDISSKVNGSGIARLSEGGVEVIEKVLERECMEMNKRFFCFNRNQRPFIVLKWAQTQEGFIGIKGSRVKISGNLTDRLVHRWRSEEDAIMVGYYTALSDNPHLNVRWGGGHNPVRIVSDYNLDLPSSLHLFDQSQTTLVLNTLQNKSEDKIEYVRVKKENLLNDLQALLFEKNILSIMVEGGTSLLQKFLDKGLWDEVRLIKSPGDLKEGIMAPVLKNAHLSHIETMGRDSITYFKNYQNSSF